MNVRATIQDETTNIPKYLSDELLSECVRLLKPRGGEEEEEELSRKDKCLHGMCQRQIEEVADIEKSYQWLEKAGLKDSTEK